MAITAAATATATAIVIIALMGKVVAMSDVARRFEVGELRMNEQNTSLLALI